MADLNAPENCLKTGNDDCFFNERLENEWDFAIRYDRPLSVVFIGIDHVVTPEGAFRQWKSDRDWRRVWEILHDYARDCDFVARYDIQEFAVILPSTDGPGAVGLAERFRAMIESEPWGGYPITASLGIATRLDSIPSADALIVEADRALFHARTAGGNRVSHIQVQEPIERIAITNRAVRNSK